MSGLYSPPMRRAWPAVVLTLCGCLKVPPSGTQTAEEPEAAVEEGDIVSKPRSLANLYAVGELRAFSFLQVGEEIGRSYGRYEGTIDRDGETLYRFSTKVELRPPGGTPLRFASELLLDQNGD